MRPFRDVSIKQKLVLILMLTSSVTLFLVCTAFVAYERIAFRDAMVRNLSVLAQIVGANTTAALTFNDQVSAEQTMSGLRAERHIVTACIYGRDGSVFAKYSREGAARDLSPPPPQPEGHRFEDGHLSLFRNIVLDGETIGTTFIRSDLQEMSTRLGRYAVIAATVTLASLLVALLLSAQLQGVISEPILSLAHTARIVSAQKDYSARAVKSGQDEIGMLIDDFNEMLVQIQRRDAALLERTAQLEAANKEMESFSYSVSHDLRVPLRAINGFARILLEEYSGRLDAEGQRLLDVIRSNAERMGQLIDDLLAFSRLGRRELERLDVDMIALARSVVEELSELEPGRSLTVSIGDLGPAWGDRMMLRQVLVNLISNAFKFTRHRSEATVEVGSGAAGNETVYFVRDNGVGFDMKYASKLFQVFQRLHGPSEFEGTGVGLAIVQRIVQRHGGRVWTEARLGEGATFYFALPHLGSESRRMNN